MRRLFALALTAILAGPAVAVVSPVALSDVPSAEDIVARNIAARGGLEAWRKIDKMVWLGHVEAAPPATAPPMRFVLELKRPNLTHFEINAQNDRFTRVFDGAQGWKVRPGRGGAPDVKAFSPEEANFARDEFVVDGPLIDYRAKGVTVKLQGLDDVDGRRAYLLNVTLPSGASRRVWVDAETWLDTRHDRPSTSPLTPNAAVSVRYGNFTQVDGLQIPLTIERHTTRGVATNAAVPVEKLVLDKVMLNPALPDKSFAKPAMPRQRRALVSIGSEAPPPPAMARPGP
jgi:hypothetical protein